MCIVYESTVCRPVVVVQIAFGAFLQTLRSDENRFSQSVTFDTQRMEDGSRGTLLL